MKLLEKMNEGMLWIAGAGILVMSVSGGLDVIFTAALGKPIPMVYELTEALMVLVVFLSLGHLQLSDSHIAMEFLQARLGPGGRRVHGVVVQVVALVCFGALIWQAWLMAWESWTLREHSVGLYPFPLYPAKFAVVIGAALASACCIAKLARAFTPGGAPAGRPPGTGPAIE